MPANFNSPVGAYSPMTTHPDKALKGNVTLL